MVGKLVKIAIALLVLNGLVRLGAAYLADYRFEDRLTEIAQFGERRTDAQLCDQALEAAQGLDLPIVAEGIRIRRGAAAAFMCGKGAQGAAVAKQGGAHKLFIDVSYERDVSILPGYARRFSFSPSIEVWARVY